jgi:hypothetical protein
MRDSRRVPIMALSRADRYRPPAVSRDHQWGLPVSADYPERPTPLIRDIERGADGAAVAPRDSRAPNGWEIVET